MSGGRAYHNSRQDTHGEAAYFGREGLGWQRRFPAKRIKIRFAAQMSPSYSEWSGVKWSRKKWNEEELELELEVEWSGVERSGRVEWRYDTIRYNFSLTTLATQNKSWFPGGA